MDPENQNQEASHEESTGVVDTEVTKGESDEEESEADNKESEEIKEHKTMAVVGYILPFLFFIPLLDDNAKNVPYARFHANQQLIVLIALLGIQFLHFFLFMILGALGVFLLGLFRLIVLVLIIIGAVNASKGNMKELPFVGGIKIL